MMKRTVSGIMLELLFIGMLMAIFNIQSVKASGPIWISSDGTVYGTSMIQRDGNLYTFLGDIYGTIEVYRSSIVIDGKGHMLHAYMPEYGTGITVRSCNVTVKNVEIKGFQHGVWLCCSPNSTISENKIITTCETGVIQPETGVWLYQSRYSTICDNNITSYSPKPVDGILIDESPYNSIVENNITACRQFGILLRYSNNNSIYENHIRNSALGIGLYQTFFSNISGNTLTNNSYGIYLEDSAVNEFYSNHISNCGNGIHLSSWSGYITRQTNTVSENKIEENGRGISIVQSSNNSIYHNNFLNNWHQVYDWSWDVPSVSPSINIWDNGYPSGGNYWSDHVCAGNPSDGSEPYTIYVDNIDHYPFQHESGWLFNTHLGSNVEFTDPLTNVTLTFDEIIGGGITTVTTSSTGPNPPAGFKVLGLYYNITTTAAYTGTIEISIPYDETQVKGKEANLRLKQYVANWQDITTWVDTVENIIYGNTTIFSIFVVMAPPILATINLDPDTLNLKSNGDFLTGYIELPEGHNVTDIDFSTVQMEGISPITDPTYGFVTDPDSYLLDIDGDGIPETYMVKYDRSTVRDALIGKPDLEEGDKFYELILTVTGELVDGTLFEGSDTIRVLSK